MTYVIGSGLEMLGDRNVAPPAVSVVVCTYNRRALLGDALESVLCQAAGTPPYEVVLVDNNSTDDTGRIGRDYAHRTGGRLRYIFEGTQGVSHARNTGVRAARGAIVAFADDDVRVAPNWIAEAVAALASRPDVDFVGGKVLPRWPRTPPSWVTPTHWGALALSDFGDSPFVVDARNPRCLISANLAVRREVFDQLGGFDPRHQHAPGSVSSVEDHEFEMRLWRAGRRGLYVPTMVVHAVVQPERLSRAYHRRWHSDHGWAVERIARPGEHFAHGDMVAPLPAGSATLLGAPIALYRDLLSAAGRSLLQRARLDGDAAFDASNDLREALGRIRSRLESAGEEGPRSLARELWTLGVLAGRRLTGQRAVSDA